MTCERIVTLLTAVGLAISKRQVVRLLTAGLDTFRAEDDAAFSAGLRASACVSVDDTAARHAGKACYTTQFGSERFTAFRAGPSKAWLAFLRNLLDGTARYTVNAAAIAYGPSRLPPSLRRRRPEQLIFRGSMAGLRNPLPTPRRRPQDR